MSYLDKYIVWDELDTCPKCESKNLYVEGSKDSFELFSTIRDLVCLNCGLKILQAVSRANKVVGGTDVS